MTCIDVFVFKLLFRLKFLVQRIEFVYTFLMFRNFSKDPNCALSVIPLNLS